MICRCSQGRWHRMDTLRRHRHHSRDTRLMAPVLTGMWSYPRGRARPDRRDRPVIWPSGRAVSARGCDVRHRGLTLLCVIVLLAHPLFASGA